MDLWFLLRTVCCNCCKRSDTQHSLLCSLCSVSVLQWPQRMTSQCQKRLSFCSIDIFSCHRVDIHHFGCHHQSLVWVVLVPGNHEGFWGVWKPWLVCCGKYPSTHLMTRWWSFAWLDEDRICTDLYTKPTDTHQYLLPTSCHPKHCCKNIPYSLALRLRRICSDSNTFELRAKELTNQLQRGGYLKQDIASAIDKARQRSRDALLSYRPKSAEVGTILPYVLTYHPDLPKVRDNVDKNMSIIESSDGPPGNALRATGFGVWTLCVHLASTRVTDSIWSYGRTPGQLCSCRQSFRSLDMF